MRSLPKRKAKHFAEKVYKATKKIPKGKVISYAAVAAAIGSPRASRAVGNALNKNPHRSVPCHRVIRSDGGVGGYARGTKEKIKILRREGIQILNNNKVVHSYVLKNIRMNA